MADHVETQAHIGSEKGLDSSFPSHEEARKDVDRRLSTDSVTREALGGLSSAELPKNYYWSYKFIGSNIAFAMSYQAQFLGYVFAANVLTIINADIGPSPNIIWVLLAYILCQCITFTIVGRLSDIFGRRWFYIAGSALGVIASFASSRAQTVNTLIGMSALNGIASAIQVQSSVTAGELLPNRWRYLGFGIMYCSLAPISAIAGGLARTWVDKTSASWRWCYYFIGMLAAISLVLEVLCYFPPKFEQLHHNHSKKQIAKSIDYIGLIMFAGSLASVLLGISWGGSVHPWRSYQVITTIVVGIIGLIAFFVWEAFTSIAFPLVPMHLFKNRNYVILMTCSTLGSMIFYALSIIWPQQIAVLFQVSPEDIGWISATITGGAIAGGAIGALTVRPIGHIKWQLVTACAFFTAFTGAMASVTSHTKGMAIAFSLLSSMGIGYMEVITIVGGPLSVKTGDIGLASGLQFSARTAFSSLADSVYVTILTNKLAVNLPKFIIPAVVAAGLTQTASIQFLGGVATGNATLIESIPGITPTIVEIGEEAAQAAYRETFKLIYLVSLAFGGTAILAACCMDANAIDGQMTTVVSRKLQGMEPIKDAEKVVPM